MRAPPTNNCKYYFPTDRSTGRSADRPADRPFDRPTNRLTHDPGYRMTPVTALPRYARYALRPVTSMLWAISP